MKKRLIAMVDMNAFLASVEQALNPELMGKPVIVGGEPGTRGIVICSSYEARKMGVGFGVPLAEAYRRLPGANFLKGDIKIYIDYWKQVQEIFNEYTPIVEPVSMDEAYLDLSGCRQNYNSTNELGQSLKEKIHLRLGLCCSVGISISKMFAKIACNMKKPDGLTILGERQIRDMLPAMPVRQLPNIGHKTERSLADLGVHSIGDIQKIPRQALVDMFGIRGAEWYEYARGNDQREVKAPDHPKTISRETTFNIDSVDRNFLAGTLYYLLERVCQKLRELNLVAGRVGVKLRYIDAAGLDDVITMRFPTDSEGEIHPYAQNLLNKIYTRRVGVRHLGVFATCLSPAFRQVKLFESERSFNLSRGLDKVRANLGYHAVYTGRTMALGKNFREVSDGYELRTPSLSQ